MKRNRLNRVMLSSIVAALLIAAIGCSNSNPLVSNMDQAQLEEPSLTLENKATFTIKGIVEKFDVDQRIIKFAGNDISTQPQTVSVGREATLALQAGGPVIPFDFKYIEIGQALSVTGQNAGSSRVGELFVLHGGIADLDTDLPSLVGSEQGFEQYRYGGIIVKMDVDARVIDFGADAFGNVTHLFHISPNAMLYDTAERHSVAFDFKFVSLGDYVVLYGTPRAEGGVDINLIVLDSKIGILGADSQPNLSSSGESVAAADFRVAGTVAKYDVDQRFIQFAGSEFDARPNSFYVDREATMILLPGQTEIPFNFKYIQVGTRLTAVGNVRADGKRSATLVEVQRSVADISTSPNSL